MKEHSILFSTEMVRAVLNDQKTQTRRIAKLPDKWHRGFRAFENNLNGAEEFVIHGDCGTETIYCPYGKVGDTLWVRETFRYAVFALGCGGRAAGIEYKTGDIKFDIKARKYAVQKQNKDKKGQHARWRPSIHMPRWAARIFLEITNIRVERVQDISPDDVIVEGIESLGWDYAESSDGTGDMFMYWADPTKDMPNWCPQSATSCECIEDVFSWLWDSLNAKRGYGWDKNPWVWVIEFKRIVKGK